MIVLVVVIVLVPILATAMVALAHRRQGTDLEASMRRFDVAAASTRDVYEPAQRAAA